MSKIYDRLGQFQSAFRQYVINRLVQSGIDPKQVAASEADCQNLPLEFNELKNIVLRNKELFRKDFGTKVNNLPTWLDDLREIRNKVAHYSEITVEDRNLAEILISKISNLVNLTDSPLKTSQTRSQNASRKLLVADSVLDSILQRYPEFQVKKSLTEYRVYRADGTRKGSIWIMPQRSGYALVTTGKAQRLDSEIERLTGQQGKERPDRPYKRWTSVRSNIFDPIFTLFGQI